MAHSTFEVRKFRLGDRYEVHFVKAANDRFFYEVEDLETLAVVGTGEDLTEEELLQAVGCAMNPLEVLQFQKLVHSLV